MLQWLPVPHSSPPLKQRTSMTKTDLFSLKSQVTSQIGSVLCRGIIVVCLNVMIILQVAKF